MNPIRRENGELEMATEQKPDTERPWHVTINGKAPRWSPGADGSMHAVPDGRYIDFRDFQSALEKEKAEREAATEFLRGLRPGASHSEDYKIGFSDAVDFALEAIGDTKGWKCDACRDTRVVLDVIATTPNGDELGEVPCPDCALADEPNRLESP